MGFGIRGSDALETKRDLYSRPLFIEHASTAAGQDYRLAEKVRMMPGVRSRCS